MGWCARQKFTKKEGLDQVTSNFYREWYKVATLQRNIKMLKGATYLKKIKQILFPTDKEFELLSGCHFKSNQVILFPTFYCMSFFTLFVGSFLVQARVAKCPLSQRTNKNTLDAQLPLVTCKALIVFGIKVFMPTFGTYFLLLHQRLLKSLFLGVTVRPLMLTWPVYTLSITFGWQVHSKWGIYVCVGWCGIPCNALQIIRPLPISTETK